MRLKGLTLPAKAIRRAFATSDHHPRLVLSLVRRDRRTKGNAHAFPVPFPQKDNQNGLRHSFSCLINRSSSDQELHRTHGEASDQSTVRSAEERRLGRKCTLYGRYKTLSASIQKKFGFPFLAIHIHSASEDVGSLNFVSTDNLIRNLDDWCETSNDAGFACLFRAERSLSSLMPPHASLELQFLSIQTVGTIGEDDSFRVRLNRNWEDCILSAQLPLFRPLRIRTMQDGGMGTNINCTVRLYFSPAVDFVEIDTLRNDASLSCYEEMTRLRDSASTVLSSLAKGMTFHGLQTISDFFAEALLRTLKPSSNAALLAKVLVEVCLEGKSDMDYRSVHSHAFWNTGEGSNSTGPEIVSETAHVQHDAVERSVQTNIENAVNSHDSLSYSDVATLTRENDERVQGDVQVEVESKADPSSSLRMGPVERKAGGILTYNDTVIYSTDLQSKTNMSSYGFSIVWKGRQRTDVSSFSPAKVRRLIDDALSRSKQTGMTCLWMILDEIKHSLPFAPEVTLRVKRKVSDIFPALQKSRYIYQILKVFVGNSPSPWVDIVTPGVPGLLLGDNFDEDGPFAFTLKLRGIPLVSLLHCNSEFLPHFICSALDEAKIIIEETVAGHTASSNLEDFAGKAASALLAKSTLFRTLIDLRGLTLRVYKYNNQGQIVRAVSGAAELGAGQDAEVEEVDEPNEVGGPDERPTSSDGIFIALGSNVGDRVEAIEAACRAIDEDQDMRVISTSALYETEPMYVEDQPRFLNGVCEIQTELPPLELLDRLQSIEQRLGRVKTVDKGPRNIDLDILFYYRQTVQSERLTIPHPRILEREFVLRPLSDVFSENLQPMIARTARTILGALPSSTSPMFTFVPLAPGHDPLKATDLKRRTVVMSILNVTPDSFSDGGAHDPADIDTLKSAMAEQIAAGATMIDIGGQSSRPNAPDITAEEEIARILPAIAAAKSLPEAKHVVISVDTYRAAVAEAAVKAGAHVINDISAGMLDPDMLQTVARLGCTYVMMHMRGTPATMQDEESTSYPDGLIPSIAAELLARVWAAQDAGIRRWRIILDPGIGFAKTHDQNLEILRQMPQLTRSEKLGGFPWLVGSSRKGFVGKATGVTEPRKRTWGTAATVTAAVQGGADIVRVHDVKEMAEVVKMADAVYRA